MSEELIAWFQGLPDPFGRLDQLLDKIDNPGLSLCSLFSSLFFLTLFFGSILLDTCADVAQSPFFQTNQAAIVKKLLDMLQQVWC